MATRGGLDLENLRVAVRAPSSGEPGHVGQARGLGDLVETAAAGVYEQTLLWPATFAGLDGVRKVIETFAVPTGSAAGART